MPPNVSGISLQTGASVTDEGLAQPPFGCYLLEMRTLTIKLSPRAEAWLTAEARAGRRSKGAVIRDLIARRQAAKQGSVGESLSDLCGSLKGSKELSTRALKGYGR